METIKKKMCEILDCLNSEMHFDCTYDWLKENEADFFKELGKKDIS